MIDKIKLIRAIREQAGYVKHSDGSDICNVTLRDAKALAEALMLKEDDWRIRTVTTARPVVTREDLNKYAQAQAQVEKLDRVLARTSNRYNVAQNEADRIARSIL